MAIVVLFSFFVVFIHQVRLLECSDPYSLVSGRAFKILLDSSHARGKYTLIIAVAGLTARRRTRLIVPTAPRDNIMLSVIYPGITSGCMRAIPLRQ